MPYFQAGRRKAAGRLEQLEKQAAKTAVKWGFRMALPYLLGFLGAVFIFLFAVGLIILTITSMCGTWTGRLASVGAGLLVGADYCKSFQSFQGVANYIDSGNLPTVSQ